MKLKSLVGWDVGNFVKDKDIKCNLLIHGICLNACFWHEIDVFLFMCLLKWKAGK